MIKRAPETTAEIKVTFAVPKDVGPVSVVGDFNDWDALATPLKARSNGTRSAIVKLPAGATFRFRYLADGGRFFDEGDCDGHEPNGYGEHHCLLHT